MASFWRFMCIENFVLPFSRQSIDFPAVHLVFTFSVKMLSDIYKHRHGMLNLSVNCRLRSLWLIWRIFAHFHQSDLKMGNLNFQIPQPKYAYFLNTVYRFIWCSQGNKKDIFNYFVILRSCLFKVETKLDANSLCLKVCLFSGLQGWQKAFITNILKHQLHQNKALCYATLASLNHSKSIPWYLAAHSCSKTGWRSTWPVPKPLARTSYT